MSSRWHVALGLGYGTIVSSTLLFGFACNDTTKGQPTTEDRAEDTTHAARSSQATPAVRSALKQEDADREAQLAHGEGTTEGASKEVGDGEDVHGEDINSEGASKEDAAKDSADESAEGGSDEHRSETKKAKAPEWVTKAPSFIDEKGQRYGVGEAPKLASKVLARATAENRARGAIARLIGAPPKSTRVDGKVLVIVEADVKGVEIIDHWTDPTDGTLYALARLAAAETNAPGTDTSGTDASGSDVQPPTERGDEKSRTEDAMKSRMK